jgi:hypothetical protein
LKSKKKTEITYETSRLVVLRKSPFRNPVWCEGCLTEIEMITPEEAAIIARVSTRAIYRWIDAGKLHFLDGPERSLLVCSTSLLAYLSISDS